MHIRTVKRANGNYTHHEVCNKTARELDRLEKNIKRAQIMLNEWQVTLGVLREKRQQILADTQIDLYTCKVNEH